MKEVSGMPPLLERLLENNTSRPSAAAYHFITKDLTAGSITYRDLFHDAIKLAGLLSCT